MLRLGVRDGQQWWRWDHKHGTSSTDDRSHTAEMPSFVHPPLISPVRLIAALCFEPSGEGDRLGRRIIIARGVMRDRVAVEAPAQEFEFEFDAKCGVILRRSTLADGQCVHLTEAVAARFGEQLDPALFAFLPPSERHASPSDLDRSPSS